MRRIKVLAWAAIFAFVFQISLSAQEQMVPKTILRVGQQAPDFTLLSDKWERVKLSDFRGKNTVILVFYVLAFSPT